MSFDYKIYQPNTSGRLLVLLLIQGYPGGNALLCKCSGKQSSGLVLQTNGDFNYTIAWGSAAAFIYAPQTWSGENNMYCTTSWLERWYSDIGSWWTWLPWGTGQLKWTESVIWNVCCHGKRVTFLQYLELMVYVPLFHRVHLLGWGWSNPYYRLA